MGVRHSQVPALAHLAPCLPPPRHSPRAVGCYQLSNTRLFCGQGGLKPLPSAGRGLRRGVCCRTGLQSCRPDAERCQEAPGVAKRLPRVGPAGRRTVRLARPQVSGDAAGFSSKDLGWHTQKWARAEISCWITLIS